MLVEREGRRRTLEKHRLGSLVGRSVGYTFTRVAQETEALRGELVVAATPLLMKKATLDLSVRVRLVDRGADAVSPSLDVTVSESLEPGEAVVVPLPNEEGGDPLFVKVTAYF